jgi:hypothetical protein
MEIYNEELIDLLDKDSIDKPQHQKRELNVKEEKNG